MQKQEDLSPALCPYPNGTGQMTPSSRESPVTAWLPLLSQAAWYQDWAIVFLYYWAKQQIQEQAVFIKIMNGGKGSKSLPPHYSPNPDSSTLHGCYLRTKHKQKGKQTYYYHKFSDSVVLKIISCSLGLWGRIGFFCLMPKVFYLKQWSLASEPIFW